MVGMSLVFVGKILTLFVLRAIVGITLGNRSLTPKLREVITYHPDTPNDEVAAKLGITEEGVRQRIKRANKILGSKSRAGATISALLSGRLKLSDIQLG